jgi:hypothetical protein
MHVEAMNWSGMGHARYAAALVFRRMRCAYSAITGRIRQRNELAIPASSVCKIETALLASPDKQISLTYPDCRSIATSGRGSGRIP